MQNATLARVIPQSVDVIAAGKTINVRPIKFGQLPAVVQASAPIMPQLQKGDYMGAAMAHPEAFIATLAAVTGLPRDEVDGLELDEVLDLAAACVEVNIDFFFRAVAPKLEGLANRIVAAIGSQSASG